MMLNCPDDRRISVSSPKRWSDLSAGQQKLIVAAAAGELSLKVAALIDLRRRPREQVRGPKFMWVALMFVNLIGPVSYFAFGRVNRGK
jgi:Phospholipase_D-nuclease N-terminal